MTEKEKEERLKKIIKLIEVSYEKRSLYYDMLSRLEIVRGSGEGIIKWKYATSTKGDVNGQNRSEDE